MNEGKEQVTSPGFPYQWCDTCGAFHNVAEGHTPPEPVDDSNLINSLVVDLAEALGTATGVGRALTCREVDLLAQLMIAVDRTDVASYLLQDHVNDQGGDECEHSGINVGEYMADKLI